MINLAHLFVAIQISQRVSTTSWLGKNDKTKIHLSKLQFTKDVWEEVDKRQQDKLHMAICGFSAEYELSDVVAHLAVLPDEWFEMSTVQRAEYVQKFNEMTVEEAMLSNKCLR